MTIFLKKNNFSDLAISKAQLSTTMATPVEIFSNYILLKVYYIIVLVFLFASTATAFTLTSQVQEGALIYGKLEKNESLFLGQTQIKTTPDGLFFFGLPQDAQTPLKLTLTKQNQIQTLSFPIKKRKWDEEFVTGLPQDKVTPNAHNQKRINQENELLRKARESFKTTLFPTCFNRPVKEYKRISSSFGSRRVLNGLKAPGHGGTDYAAPIGTPVYAPTDGIIALVHSDMFLSGKTLLINHGYGLFSSYSHLNTIQVKHGQKVKVGDVVGQIGTTGRSTGPHLHYTITWLGVRIDPEQQIAEFMCK